MLTLRAVRVEARTLETNRVILLWEGTSKLGGIIYELRSFHARRSVPAFHLGSTERIPRPSGHVCLNEKASLAERQQASLEGPYLRWVKGVIAAVATGDGEHCSFHPP